MNPGNLFKIQYLVGNFFLPYLKGISLTVILASVPYMGNSNELRLWVLFSNLVCLLIVISSC
jgi:hypothetical protein